MIRIIIPTIRMRMIVMMIDFVCEDNCQENNLSSTKLHFINYLLRLTKPIMSLSETIVRRFIVKEFSLSLCPVTFFGLL